MSPGCANRAAPATTRSMGPSPPVSPGSTSITGTSGACRESDSLMTGASRPRSTTPRSRSRTPATRSSKWAPLASPPATHTTGSYPCSEASAACGLVALESSIQVTSSTTATSAIRWPSGRKRAQRLLHRPGGHAVGPGERRRREGVRDEVRGVRREVGEGAQLGGRGLPLLDERPVGEHVVDQPEHPDARRAEGEPDGPGAVLHLGVADQLLGDLVGHVVDARPLDAVVDPALVGGVAGHAATRSVVPVEVVLRDVEHRGRLRLDRGGVVQLEAGELDRQDVVRRGVHHRLDDGQADVAAGDRPQAAGAQHRLEHLHGRGLAVRAGDGQPRRRVLGVAQPPGQLDLAPDRDASLDRLGQQRRRGRPAGRGHHEVDLVGQLGGGARAEAHRRTQDLQQGGLLATVARLGLVEGGHPRAEVGQVVRGGEAGDTEARDDGTDTAPVAGATERVDTVGHTPATHSA